MRDCCREHTAHIIIAWPSRTGGGVDGGAIGAAGGEGTETLGARVWGGVGGALVSSDARGTFAMDSRNRATSVGRLPMARLRDRANDPLWNALACAFLNQHFEAASMRSNDSSNFAN